MNGKHWRFIIIWIILWLPAFFVPAITTSVIGNANQQFIVENFHILEFAGHVLGIAIAGVGHVLLLQTIVDIRIRDWMLLTVAGYIVGNIAHQILLSGIPQPTPIAEFMVDPIAIGHLKYALYWTASYFLRYGIPLLFQWFIIRKYWARNHLWVMGAVLLPLVAYTVFDGSGMLALIATTVVDWLVPHTSDAVTHLASVIGHLADFLILFMLMPYTLVLMIQQGSYRKRVNRDSSSLAKTKRLEESIHRRPMPPHQSLLATQSGNHYMHAIAADEERKRENK